MKRLIFPAVVLAALCLFSASAGAQTTYTVKNNSGMVITGVSLSPNDVNLYGMNLNTAGFIAQDVTFQFTRLVDKSSCLYDVRYMSEDGKYYYIQDVDLCSSTTITLPRPTDTKYEKK